MESRKMTREQWEAKDDDDNMVLERVKKCKRESKHLRGKRAKKDLPEFDDLSLREKTQLHALIAVRPQHEKSERLERRARSAEITADKYRFERKEARLSNVRSRRDEAIAAMRCLDEMEDDDNDNDIEDVIGDDDSDNTDTAAKKSLENFIEDRELDEFLDMLKHHD